MLFSSRQSKYQKGNVFFFIALGIFLFGALSYAVTRTSGSGTTEILDEENAKISQGKIDAYAADIRAGVTQLQLDGCRQIDYTPPADQVAGDKSCHMFHSEGAGVTYKDIGLGAGCPLTDLAVGQKCNGVVYAGVSGGRRIYATIYDSGVYIWNNGSTNHVVTGATSTSDGLANTNILVNATDVGAPYTAAQICRNLGAKWYLPAQDEVAVLRANRSIIGNFQTGGGTASTYLSSTEVSQTQMSVHAFTSDLVADRDKDESRNVRCIRRD